MTIPNSERVQPVKWESTSEGGGQDDQFPTGVDPSVDALEARGIYLEPASPTARDEAAYIYRDGNNIKFRDAVETSELTLTSLKADEKSKVSSNDTTSDYLANKLTGDGITWTQVNDGSNETFKATVNSNSAYKFEINPALLMTTGNASKVLANDYAAIEIASNQTSFGVWSGSWKRTPTANVTIKVRFIMKSSGSGSYVRIALKIKSRATGEDTSTAFDYSNLSAVLITYTTVGQIFEATFSVSNTIFAEGDSTALHAGRDGHNDMGGGQNDTATKAIQIISIDVDIP
jgi:hypothetical protein